MDSNSIVNFGANAYSQRELRTSAWNDEGVALVEVFDVSDEHDLYRLGR